ncbi:MAG: DUF4421 domain-containing protein [Flavobacteriales bacterium]|nr:DUF4421 domain-containing protein [Flavobacteriales bacterium]MCB9166688.1 DUF4421 domain-containing protein [Flavobacteriales bacterium]
MKRKKHLQAARIAGATALFLLLGRPAAHAQDTTFASNGGFDPDRVIDLTHRLTLRVYGSTKFNSMDLEDGRQSSRITYRPNTNVNLGVGASYRSLTLNIGVGFPFLNGDQELRGRTRYFDAQGNMYGRRYAINLFAQVYQGYYIDALSYPGSAAGDPLYQSIIDHDRLRPDMHQENLGASVIYIVNNRKFSYRAAFNQDAWQRRSAGSMLVGGYADYQGMRSDRTEIPTPVDTLFDPALRFRRIDLYELGGLFGYVHTFVIGHHVFLSASFAGGIGLGRSETFFPEAEGDTSRVHLGLELRIQQRLAFGYNGNHACVGVSYTNERSTANLGPDVTYGWNVGNFRLFVAYRIPVRIGIIEKAMRRLKGT